MSEEHKLSDSVESLPGVGSRRAALYHKLGVETIRDLLTFYPRDYLDLSKPIPILQAALDEPAVIKATVTHKFPERRIREGLSLFRAVATDGETDFTVTIFNSPWLFDSLKVGGEYLFYGKVAGSLTRREMPSPLFVPAAESAVVRPVYHLTEGLTNKVVQANMTSALKVWGDVLADSLPEALLRERGLCRLRYAMENIHFPADPGALELARKRLIYEELLTLQLGMQLLRRRRRVQTDVRLADCDLSEWEASLPFALTGGQQQAIAEALADMRGDTPMNRLLQGDVGSGKTMVAAALCFVCRKNGYQAAVMAPTQILAKQHFQTFSRQLAPLGVECELLTSGLGAKQRREALGRIRTGEVAVVVGTHALLREDVEFRALGLVVTDEQHRFGVAQRAVLAGKGANPHLLVMSATPIPRTLSILIYGDLDVSAIRELPRGRQPVDTFAVDSAKRGRALGFVKKQLDQGRQAYIVCPLIDENGSDLVSTRQYIAALQKTPLAAYRIEALHGRMKPREKEALMAGFLANEIQILVSTTVIEVGVDVPNANVILVENAERFGLSQLHQLRGRVGRGEYKSFCILISDNEGEDGQKRLEVMTATADGFRIAEEDLRLRGPGDFFGTRQHGLPELKVANLLDDMAVLQEARRDARALLKADPELTAPENRGLAAEVARLFDKSDQVALN